MSPGATDSCFRAVSLVLIFLFLWICQWSGPGRRRTDQLLRTSGVMDGGGFARHGEEAGVRQNATGECGQRSM